MQYLQYKDNILPGVSTFLISLLVTLVLWYDIFLPDFTASGGATIVGDSPLAHLLNGYLPFDSLWGRVIALLCLIITAFCITGLNDTFGFISVRTVLPGLVFIVIVSLLMRPHVFSTAWITTLCAVLFVNSTFKLVEGNPEKFILRAFDAGLVLSLSTLFAMHTAILAIPFFVLQYRCNTLNLKLFFAFLTGWVLPYFYCILITLGIGDIEPWTNYWREWFHFDGTPITANGLDNIIYMGIICLLFIFAFQHFLHTRSSQNIRSREEVVFLISCFFTTIVIMLMNLSEAHIILPTCIFFVSFIIGQYFTLEWSRLSKILLIIFALSSILFFVQPNFV